MWFQVFLSNGHIWLIDGTPDKTKPGSNDIEGVVYTPQIHRNRRSLMKFPRRLIQSYTFVEDSKYTLSPIDSVESLE